ncbi:MAG: hypothetical protein JWO60_2793, partial [Frankiales bacterium]|nr:hypothetical protein [Frankiales bacterium]
PSLTTPAPTGTASLTTPAATPSDAGTATAPLPGEQAPAEVAQPGPAAAPPLAPVATVSALPAALGTTTLDEARVPVAAPAPDAAPASLSAERTGAAPQPVVEPAVLDVAAAALPQAPPVGPPAPVGRTPLEVAAAQAPAQVQPAVAELARGLRDVGGGRASLVVRLDPPELGPVVVRLSVRDGRVDVQLRTGEAVAAVGLAQASAEVRSTLADHGLDLSSFDVEQGALPPGAGQHPGERRESPDRATPRPARSADRTAGATGTGALLGATTTTDGGTPAATWL